MTIETVWLLHFMVVATMPPILRPVPGGGVYFTQDKCLEALEAYEALNLPGRPKGLIICYPKAAFVLRGL